MHHVAEIRFHGACVFSFTLIFDQHLYPGRPATKACETCRKGKSPSFHKLFSNNSTDSKFGYAVILTTILTKTDQRQKPKLADYDEGPNTAQATKWVLLPSTKWASVICAYTDRMACMHHHALPRDYTGVVHVTTLPQQKNVKHIC